MATIPHTDLDVHPLCLGGNVFGWTADRDESFAVLDAYAAAGGNFIDTADLYAGGESEKIVGAWMAERGNRDDIVVATKMGMKDGSDNLRADTVKAQAEASLAALGTDHIDLYYAHQDDEDTPVAETLGAFDELVQEGKVRHIAASNFSAAAAGGGGGDLAPRGPGPLRGAPAPLQPDGARRVRGRGAGHLPGQRPGGVPVLRAGQRLPDRQVPVRRRRQQARQPLRGRPAADRPCWRRWTRSRARTTCPRPRSRWPGWPRRTRCCRRSPARAPPSSWTTCWPSSAWSSATTSVERLTAASAR